MTPNPIHRDAHPAAPISPGTEWPYDLRAWIGYMLEANGLTAEMRIWLINERGRVSGEIWNVSRKERTG